MEKEKNLTNFHYNGNTTVWGKNSKSYAFSRSNSHF